MSIAFMKQPTGLQMDIQGFVTVTVTVAVTVTVQFWDAPSDTKGWKFEL